MLLACDGLFVHSAGNDAEWFENVWNWLRKHGMRLWCMLFYFVNFMDENDVFGKNPFASDVIWTANEFRSVFDVGEFEVNIFVVFQTHVHAFFNNSN